MKRFDEYHFSTKLANFILVFLPFLAPYRLFGTTTSLQTVFLFGVPIYIYKSGVMRSWRWPRLFRLFFIYALIVPFIGYISYGSIGHFISSYMPIVTFTMAYIILTPYLEWDLLVYYFRKLSLCAISFFFLQEVMYHFVGWRIVGVLPFMPFVYTNMSMSEYIAIFSVLSRSSSFFLEPAHFSQYIIVYLAVELCILKSSKKLANKYSVITTIALLLTFSGSAYVLLLVLWAIHLITCKIHFIYKALIAALIIFGSTYVKSQLESYDEGSKIISRANSLSSDNYGDSEMIRIFRGWQVYEDMPEVLKITGVGSSNITEIINNSKHIFLFEDEDRYVNNAQCLAMGYGYIGSIIFITYLLFLIVDIKNQAYYIIPLFILLCFFECFWCRPMMLLYLGISTINNSNYGQNSI